jgi:hypothetical protein
MHSITTEIEIRASAAHVWSLLTRFSAYPDWNPFVRAIEGVLTVGSTLKVCVQPAGGKPMRFEPTLLAAAPQRELRWKGKLLFSGLFDGEHYFQIEERADGVLFRQGENFSGILVPLLWSSLERPTRRGFEQMNQALKQEAEKP